MIVPGMSPALIRQEFLKGKQCLYNKLSSNVKKLRKGLGSARNRFHKTKYTDPNKNLWRLYIVAGRKNYRMVCFLQFNDPKQGIQILLENEQTHEIYQFTGHFFRRFKERTGVEMEDGDVYDNIYCFILLNSNFKGKLLPGNCYHMELPTGVGLGYPYGEGVYIIRTFISHEQLKGQQEVLSALLQEELERENGDYIQSVREMLQDKVA